MTVELDLARPSQILVEPLKTTGGRTDYLLTAPTGRTLKVLFLSEGADGASRIDTFLDAGREHGGVPGTTSALYERGHDVMVEEATRRGTVLPFNFDTSYPSMAAWALDPNKGRRIFQWDDVTGLLLPVGGLYKALTTIYPRLHVKR